MKKILAILVASSLLLASPASAWYRGGGYYGGYYGGWGYGGAALGIGLGLGLLGGLAAGSMNAYGPGPYYRGYVPYGGYYNCVPRPIYDAWGQTVGYAAC